MRVLTFSMHDDQEYILKLTQPVLYYIHDPMCSWCWGYRPTWELLREELQDLVAIEYVAGGLAPDTDQPMPEQMQREIQAHWRNTQTKLGAEFNFDFWTQNSPRRATYLACRAVIAAKNQGYEKEMVSAIQNAYYLRAMNPSERDVLLQLATELSDQGVDIDPDRFAAELESRETDMELARQITFAQTLTNKGFPSLVLEHNNQSVLIEHDYLDHTNTLDTIKQTLDI